MLTDGIDAGWTYALTPTRRYNVRYPRGKSPFQNKYPAFWISQIWSTEVRFDFRRGRSPTAPSRTQSETEKPWGTLVCNRVLSNRDALEPEAASEGALQEMGKRCSHRTCGRRTFPITATKALSARCGWENCADIDSAGGHCAHCTLDDAHSVVSTGSVAQIG
jgi:hypothetical protein